MNPEKSNIKLALLHEQGVKWDDWLEAKERQQSEMDGAILALRQARERIFNPIFAAVKADLDGGKLDKLEPLEFASYVNKQIKRVELALQNMQMNAERERIVAEGRAAQMRDVVAMTKDTFKGEQTALVAHQESAKAGEIDKSGRPAMSASADIANRRAKAKKAKKRTRKKGANGAAHAR